MSLKIDLSISPPACLFEEDPMCRIRLTNIGSQPMRVVHPATGSSLPVWKAVSISSGIRVNGTRAAGLFKAEFPQLLAPGGVMEHETPLFTHLQLSEPGDYEVTIGYEWIEEATIGKARSEPARFTLKGSRPGHCHLVNSTGGAGPAMDMVWIDKAPETPRFMFSRLSLGMNPRIFDTCVIGPAKGTERPVLSVPYNGKTQEKLWAAWLEDDFVFGFRLKNGALEKKWQDISEAHRITVPTTIIPPLLPVKELQGSSVAAILCRDRGPDKQASIVARFLSDARFTDEIDYGPNLLIPMGPPQWAEGVALSNGDRRIYTLGLPVEEKTPTSTTWGPRAPVKKAAAKGPLLACVLWTANDPEILQLAEEIPFEGTFAGAGVWLGSDDVVRGAVLLQAPISSNGNGASPISTLKLYRWSHEARGDIRVAPPISVPWPPDLEVEEAKLVGNERGEVWGLVRGEGGSWERFSMNHPNTVPVQSLEDSRTSLCHLFLRAARVQSVLNTGPGGYLVSEV